MPGAMPCASCTHSSLTEIRTRTLSEAWACVLRCRCAIRKRTASENVCWINSGWGHRASGTGYIGGPSGGIAFGLRDFWQRHPTQLDIRNATSDTAQVTMWLWSPEAQAMDLRFYHTGL